MLQPHYYQGKLDPQPRRKGKVRDGFIDQAGVAMGSMDFRQVMEFFFASFKLPALLRAKELIDLVARFSLSVWLFFFSFNEFSFTWMEMESVRCCT